ncbi:conjugative transposon protein TraN [Mucilaginibacter sp. RS28]|uniref:Conjugative transposon protein TraN n=1 Tax=Mucilaginibacter straminoryzae TaxID=2932774 RepID=A0A9X1WYR2_9SPHI|nr:conjugative transposon protein TraN [Mucilaginibacter straminoryzae]MCJ8208117.1 conjugative transposon protein TraN [Mucilaginibacter straminoryzae]
MKQIFFFMAALLLSAVSFAQQTQELGTAALITPYHLEVTDQKTTVILLPSPIQSVDRGTAFLLAEKVKGSENVLKVKAQNKFLPASNLSVVTADGQLFSFTVDYSASPAYQAIDLKRQQLGKKPDVVLSATTVNESYLQQQAISVFAAKPFMDKSARSHRMRLQLLGIYGTGDLLYFRFTLANGSHVGYQTGTTRFFVTDRKRAKRTAQQESDQSPVYISPDATGELGGRRQRQFVVAFNRFTIADNKRLVVEWMERGGDRNISLSLRGEDLLQAAQISK